VRWTGGGTVFVDGGCCAMAVCRAREARRVMD
jgi:lipoate-protein ligase A